MKRFLGLVFLAILLGGCQTASARTLSTATTAAATAPIPTTAAQPDAVTAAPPTLYVSGALPSGVLDSLKIPPGITRADAPEGASLELAIGSKGTPVSTWIYALAAPFPTLQDEVSLAELKGLWTQGTAIGSEGQALLVDENTLNVFTEWWGEPSSAVRQAPAASLLDQAWQERKTWAILPFEQLEPRWKVLSIDGQSPIHKDFDPALYGLSLPVSLSGDPALIDQILGAGGPDNPAPLAAASNRRADHLTTVILTGTTSLVRATAALMELHGMDYPAQDIGAWLRAADILHISNEIAFAKNCPSPLPHTGLKFCSQPRYIQLLEDIGTSVVDLSGDHLNDYGPEALSYTIDLYHQRGWQTYGGGENLAAGQQPALFEKNGNKIAFLGCNYKQVGYASASASEPGAVHCDPAWLYPAIQKLKSQGYLVIVTLQDDEYMEAIARPKLKSDFQGAADAGAALVSGTQAHQPQAFDFRNGVFIHYGLGNLFFDQIHAWETTNEAFIDRHVIYENRVISSEILTTVFVDFARPRPMTPEERRGLLQMIFKASGW